MDLLVLLKQQSTKIVGHLSAFRDDVLRLLRASPVFGGAVIGTGIILGFAPILLWQFFGKFIDACFGARGVGTMTTDLSHNAFIVGTLGVVLVVAGMYFLQTKALSRTIASTIAVFAIIITHSIALLPIQKSFIVFLVILAVGFHITRHKAARISMGVVLGLLTVSTISDILFMMTRRSMTVGSALQYCAVVLTFALISMCIARRK